MSTTQAIEPTLSEQLSAALAEVAALKEANAEATKFGFAVTAERDAAQKENAELTAKLSASEKTRDEFKAKAESAEKQVGELTTKLADAEKQAKAVEQKAAELMAGVGCTPPVKAEPPSQQQSTAPASYTEQVQARKAQMGTAGKLPTSN
jgi:chromosome segregation ATPase